MGVCNGSLFILDLTSQGDHDGLFDFHKMRKAVVDDYTMDQTLSTIQANLSTFMWQDLPEITESDYRECDLCNARGLLPNRSDGCEECDDSGRVEFENDFSSYEAECKSCEGEGNAIAGGMSACSKCRGTKKHLDYVPVWKISSEWSLNGEYLPLLAKLDGIKITWLSEYEYFVFQFVGGFGVILPMRT